MTKTAIAAEVIAREELLALAKLEARYAAAKKEIADCEKALEAERLDLAGKVLGVEASKDLRLLDPEHVEKLMAVRREDGLWRPARNAPPFVFLKTSSGRYPSWKAEFIALEGEAKAEKIVSETPMFYSYRVDVAV